MVIHEGKQPNPIEVILIAQNLSYRYRTNLSKAQHPQQTEGQSQLCASMCWEELADSHQDCRDKEEKSK